MCSNAFCTNYKHFRVRWSDSEVVKLSDDLQIFTTAAPTSGLPAAFIIRIMDRLLATGRVDKRSLDIYQCFVEAMKHGIAQHTNTGDIIHNDIAELTNQVGAYHFII